jgi:tetrahydromethanopterin S-methyltransferase subunit E
MKGWKTFLVILGIVVILSTCFYDQIVGQEVKFGPKAWAGMIAGVIILVIGLVLKSPKKEEKKEEKK